MKTSLLSLSVGLIVLLMSILVPAESAVSDVMTPERALRRERVARWNRQHPGTRPGIAVRTSQDRKHLELTLTFRCRAAYEIKAGNVVLRGSVDAPGGGVSKELLPVPVPSEGDRTDVVVEFRFTLHSPSDATGVLKDDQISGCIFRRYDVPFSGDVIDSVQERGLDNPMLFMMQRGCSM